jgi:AraC-like DNA-binding protein
MYAPGTCGLPAGVSPSDESPFAAVVVALVPRVRAARLAAALAHGVRIHHIDSLMQLRLTRGSLCGVVVIDPLVSELAPELDAALRDMAATCSFIVYTSVSPTAMRRLLNLPALAGATLILDGVDDSPELLRAAIGAAQATAHGRRALEQLQARAGSLPREVAEALVALLTTDGRKLSVIELARESHMGVRTLERRLDDAGAPPPLWLIRTARALLARELLCTSSMTVQEVARRVGYAKLDSLRVLLRRSFDSSPSALRVERDRTSGPWWDAHRRPARRRMS